MSVCINSVIRKLSQLPSRLHRHPPQHSSEALLNSFLYNAFSFYFSSFTNHNKVSSRLHTSFSSTLNHDEKKKRGAQENQVTTNKSHLQCPTRLRERHPQHEGKTRPAHQRLAGSHHRTWIELRRRKENTSHKTNKRRRKRRGGGAE